MTLPTSAPFSIDPSTGAIRIGEQVELEAGQRQARIEPQIAPWRKGSRDFGNGYAWLDLEQLSFASHPAWLSLCFRHGRLAEASWSVALPGQSAGWPSREEIDAELALVRDALARMFGLPPAEEFTLPWGEAWSLFDPKGYLAANGLRYRR